MNAIDETKKVGRVLGSQIYVGENIEDVTHETPFDIRDIFIKTTNGNIYQFDGTEWVYCYTIGAGTLGYMVRYAFSDSEALTYDANSVVIVIPTSGVPRVTRVALDTFGNKELQTVGVGDGALPYITKAVNDLLNYYNKTEVDAKIAAIHTIEFLVVDELPIVGQSNIIYLVPHTHGVADLYDEYCWVASESKYEKIGNTDALVNYYNKDETDALLAGKQNTLTFDNEPTAGSNNPVTSEGIKNAIDASASRVYRYKGSLPYYANLPVSGNVIGDVYNIENADPSHGVKAGDNVAWNGLAWDVLAGAVDLTNYYTKAEVDAAVSPKANSADVYTKLEENALLAEKADKSTTYTKTETDALLAPKANSADVNAGLALKADKATTYTKTEDDALLAGKADKSTTYTKSEVDAIAAGKADANNVYTKAQADSLLANKANGSDVYTKAEVGNLLAPKANSADVYAKSETYSEEQVDSLLAGKVDKVSGKQLSTEDYTTAEKSKLGGIEAGAQVNDVTSVAGKTGAVTLNKGDVGLGNVENTSDAQKPVSAAQQAALDLKANKSETYTKSEVNTLLSPKADRSELGTAASKNVGTASGNVPIIGADGKIDPTVMPAIAMSNTYVASSQADMLALTARVGDVAVRTDENKTYILKETGADTLSHWQELLVPTDDVLEALINPFLTTEAYSKGDYVVYSNVLYRFTADKSAGSWDSTKVETATLNDLIDDVNAAVASVDNKLTKGDYDGTTGVGYADVASSLQTEVGNDDETPFAYQTAGGESDLETGMQILKKLVGASVVKNQQMRNANFASTSGWTAQNGTLSVSNNVARVTCTTAGDLSLKPTDSHETIANHKYLVVAETRVSSKDVLLSTVYVGNEPRNSSTEFSFMTFISYRESDISASYPQLIMQNAEIGDWFEARIVQLIDLTQRYGSNDVVDAIIGSTASTQFANLLRFDPSILKDLSHDDGSLVSSKSAKLKTVGYNLLKDVIDVSQTAQSFNRELDYPVEVIGQTIGIVATTNALAPFVVVYDINGEKMCEFFLNGTSNGQKYGHSLSAVTGKIGAIRFFYDGENGTSGPFTYINVALFLYWDGSRIGYEPYEEHEYALPNKELRGVLKVVDGKVVADGDELYPNTTGKTRYGTYTFTGNETWSQGIHAYRIRLEDAKSPVSDNDKANAICEVLDVVGVNYLNNGSIVNGFGIAIGGYLYIGSDTYTNRASLVGKTVVYELATPIDLTDQPAFAENIYVDDFGTMEFLDENDQQIAGLQGAEVFYKANVAGFAESLYVKTDGNPNDLVTQDDLPKHYQHDIIVEFSDGTRLGAKIVNSRSTAYTVDSIQNALKTLYSTLIVSASVVVNGVDKPAIFLYTYQSGDTWYYNLQGHGITGYNIDWSAVSWLADYVRSCDLID